jgi:hypothetical protein
MKNGQAHVHSTSKIDFEHLSTIEHDQQVTMLYCR